MRARPQPKLSGGNACALVAGRTTTGRGGKTVIGLPHDRLPEILRRHGVLVETPGR